MASPTARLLIASSALRRVGRRGPTSTAGVLVGAVDESFEVTEQVEPP
ncbi:hypothetical protein [Desertimonas flava]|nr:hypothetical protein [Desertimonas flava]